MKAPERYCQICNLGEIENEVHFIWSCTAYSTLTEKCMKAYLKNMMAF